MDRQSVKSTHLISVGYDRDTAVLEVEFNDGSIYQYENVPHGHWALLIGSPSVGKTFASIIKGKFKTTRIKGPGGSDD